MRSKSVSSEAGDNSIAAANARDPMSSTEISKQAGLIFPGAKADEEDNNFDAVNDSAGDHIGLVKIWTRKKR